MYNPAKNCIVICAVSGINLSLVLPDCYTFEKQDSISGMIRLQAECPRQCVSVSTRGKGYILSPNFPGWV
jgi:hypothetical protein